jgi:hypothetical protein
MSLETSVTLKGNTKKVRGNKKEIQFIFGLEYSMIP